jgi:hypothetical protein
MPSPIFVYKLIKKYTLQSRRSNQEAWKEVESYRTLGEAEIKARQLTRQKAKLEARIINRLTKAEVRRFPK